MPYIELQELSLFLLMYADDMVLLAQSAPDLQALLNSLEVYTDKWSLEVNVIKTKIMIFRNGGKIRTDEEWFYKNEKIDVVDSFCYLGLLLNCNGKFFVTQKQLSLQCKKAVFALKRKCLNMQLNIVTLLSLFDSYIGSIACYGCEVWGFHAAPDIEKIQTDFCKNMLGVKRSTPNSVIYCELGRLPFICIRKIRILKYWLKLLKTNNCILKNCYEDMNIECESRSNCKNWVSEVKHLLCSIGLIELWINQRIEKPEYILGVAKQRLFDMYKQSILSDIDASPKCFIYKNLVDNFTLQNYLLKRIPFEYKKLICKLRLSSHCLSIETGRYKKIPFNRRYCPICNQDVEDEFHFILKCPHYIQLRQKFIKRYYFVRPSVYKLIQLLSTPNVKELCGLGKYIKYAFILRKNIS